MWSTTILIAYQPEFTPGFKRFIESKVNSEFSNDDTSQYEIQLIEDAMNESGEKFDNQDLMIITELHKKDISYVEF